MNLISLTTYSEGPGIWLFALIYPGNKSIDYDSNCSDGDREVDNGTSSSISSQLGHILAQIPSPTGKFYKEFEFL